MPGFFYSEIVLNPLRVFSSSFVLDPSARRPFITNKDIESSVCEPLFWNVEFFQSRTSVASMILPLDSLYSESSIFRLPYIESTSIVVDLDLSFMHHSNSRPDLFGSSVSNKF